MNRSRRAQRIIGLTDLGDGPGLEIAPLNHPIMLKSRWDVSYVDIVTTEELRQHYAGDPRVPGDEIAEVDFALTGSDGVVRRLSEVADQHTPYSWVLASHVIEHVPDIITWLEDISYLLRDGGTLVLAIPDMRYSFDAYRPQTTVGQMLQARHQGDVVPGVRAVFDHLRSASTISLKDAWAGRYVGLEHSRSHELHEVLAKVEQARAGQYVDSHVWTFRPSTFIEQINELGRLGMCDLVVETVLNTRPNELEFYAVLRRLPRDRSPEQDAKLRAAAKHRTDDEPGRFLPKEPTPLVLSPRETAAILRKRKAVDSARRLAGRVRRTHSDT